MSTHGFFVLDKPRQVTSYAMVSLVKKLTRTRHVGHCGTLDPFATGVLPIAVGAATRLQEYVLEGPKVYRADVAFGTTTDTYDTEGAVVATAATAGVTEHAVEAALGAFRGTIMQTPPQYSAIKRGGRPLYAYAREGITVAVEPRPVTITRLVLLGWTPPIATLEIECGHGTYIRSLAHDLGQALGCGAHLSGLTRLQTGPFTIDDAVTPDALREVFDAGRWQSLLQPLDAPVRDWPAVTVSASEQRALRDGQSIRVDVASPAGEEPVRMRAYDSEGRLIALLHYDPDSGTARPFKVLHTETASVSI